MKKYVLKRILYLIPTVFIVSIIIFIMIRMIPGDIVDLMASDMGMANQMDKAEIEHRLGLDEPLLIQYGRWIGILPNEEGRFSGIFQGDFGNSLWTGTPIMQSVKDRLPVTLELGILGFIFAHLISIPLGIYSALRRDSVGDMLTRSFAVLCIAVPSFWLATMIIVYPSIWWGYMPSVIWIPFRENPMGNLKMVIIPAMVLGIELSGSTTRLMRTRMIDVLGQDYIRTAWAKGLKERLIILRHALKNSLISVVTMSGMQVASIFGGAVIVEKIFSIPGMGRLILEATNQRDYPVISGLMFFMAIIVMLTNLGVDLLYGVLDPRISYE